MGVVLNEEEELEDEEVLKLNDENSLEEDIECN